MTEPDPRWRRVMRTRPVQRWTRREAVTGPLPIADVLRGTPYAAPQRMTTPDDAQARQVLGFGLDLAELLLRCGAGTAEVEASVLASMSALGMADGEVDLDITYASVVIGYAPADSTPMAMVRVVRGASRDYSRLSAAHALVLDLVAGDLSRGEAFKRLEQARTAPKPYPRWLVTVAWGGLAAAVAVRLGGGAGTALLAFAATGGVDRVGLVLARRGIPGFFLTAVGAALATAVALVAVGAGAQVRPELVVAGGIVALLPGTALVASVQDGIRGFPVTAVGRLANVVLTTGAIIVGLALALRIGDAAGVLVVIDDPTAAASGVEEGTVRAVAAAVGAASSAVTVRSPRRLLPVTALTGALGYGVLAVSDLMFDSAAFSTALACVVIGLIGRVFALRRNAPALAVVAPAVTTLLPGLLIFEGMRELTDASLAVASGVVTLLEAGTVALAIGAGVVLGDQLARPVERGIESAVRGLPRREHKGVR